MFKQEWTWEPTEEGRPRAIKYDEYGAPLDYRYDEDALRVLRGEHQEYVQGLDPPAESEAPLPPGGQQVPLPGHTFGDAASEPVYGDKTPRIELGEGTWWERVRPREGQTLLPGAGPAADAVDPGAVQAFKMLGAAHRPEDWHLVYRRHDGSLGVGSVMHALRTDPSDDMVNRVALLDVSGEGKAEVGLTDGADVVGVVPPEERVPLGVIVDPSWEDMDLPGDVRERLDRVVSARTVSASGGEPGVTSRGQRVLVGEDDEPLFSVKREFRSEPSPDEVREAMEAFAPGTVPWGTMNPDAGPGGEVMTTWMRDYVPVRERRTQLEEHEYENLMYASAAGLLAGHEDLHAQNMGFDGHGDVVVIDYEDAAQPWSDIGFGRGESWYERALRSKPAKYVLEKDRRNAGRLVKEVEAMADSVDLNALRERIGDTEAGEQIIWNIQEVRDNPAPAHVRAGFRAMDEAARFAMEEDPELWGEFETDPLLQEAQRQLNHLEGNTDVADFPVWLPRAVDELHERDELNGVHAVLDMYESPFDLDALTEEMADAWYQATGMEQVPAWLEEARERVDEMLDGPMGQRYESEEREPDMSTVGDMQDELGLDRTVGGGDA